MNTIFFPFDKYRLLFLLSFLCLLIFTIPGTGFIYAWISLSLLATYVIFKQKSKIGITPLFIAMTGYTVVMLLNLYFINPAFQFEGLYFVSFFYMAFLTGRLIDADEFRFFYKIIIAVFALLAIWAVFQSLSGSAYITDAGRRANTIFNVPNNYAASINLILIPLILYRASHKRNLIFDFLIFLFLIALAFTQSRGGWIAFFAGVIPGLIMLRYSGLSLHYKELIRLTLMIFIATAVFASLTFNFNWLSFNTQQLNKTETEQSNTLFPDKNINIDKKSEQTKKKSEKISSLGHRFQFYEIAWNQFLKKAWAGNGYFNFRYFLERDKTESIKKTGVSNFVHNDYLQHLMETGIIGLSTLLLLLLVFYFQILKTLSKSDRENKKTLIICFATATASFFHALGDYVFYIPCLSVLLGMLIGYSDRIYSRSNDAAVFSSSSHSHRKSIMLRAGLLTLFILYFSKPIIAGVFIRQAEEEKRANNLKSAAQLSHIAQKLAPYEAVYTLFEARLYLQATKMTKSREAANAADQLLSIAIIKNPYEQDSLLAKSLLHRSYSSLLNNPVNLETIIHWQKTVLHWQPTHRLAQSEHVKTLLIAGQKEEANKIQRQLQNELLRNSRIRSLIKKAFNPD